MATGDITSIVIRPDGFSAEITIEGFTSGADYNFGLDTGNVPTASTPYLTVVRKGFDDDGLDTTLTDTVYLTAIMRVPYATKTQAGGTWSGTFVDGEVITCSVSGATAVVVGNQSSGAVLRYKSLTGTPLTGQTWSGAAAAFVNTSSTVTTLTVPTEDELVTSTGLIARVSLSEYVYVKEKTGAGNSGTAPTITAPAAWVTNTGGASQTSAALTAAAVTNNSTAAYQPVLGNWSYPFHGSLMDATSKLRVVAFDRHARLGRPVRCVKFTVYDGTTTNTEIVVNPTLTTDLGDQVPVIEYVTITDLTSGLTQGANLTLNFQIYPWVGDSDNDLISSDGGFSYPTPLHCTLTAVCDKDGTYGKSFAVVDAATGSDPAVGSDSGKWVGDGTAHGTGAGLTPYLTIGRAVRAVRDRNNATSGRDDVSGSVVYVKAGSYKWLDYTTTFGATPNAFITIKPYTGVARADFIISGRNLTYDISDRVKIENATITSTTDNTFTGCLAMWFDNCDFNMATGTLWASTGQRLWVTHTKVTNFGQGFRCFSTNDTAFSLVRGCDLDGLKTSIIPYTVIGNRKDGDLVPTAQLILGSVSGQNAPDPQSQILAYNRFYGYKSSAGTLLSVGANADLPVRGIAIVQNVFESTGISGAQHSDIGAAEVTTNTPVDNVIIWHNTFMGERQLMAYDSNGSTIKYRRFWSQKNNIFSLYGYKGDDYTPSPDGVRVGNWSICYGVGTSGNVAIDNGSNLFPLFAGLEETHRNISGLASSYWGFVDYQAAFGAVAGAGDGDYRLLSTSPAIKTNLDLVLPYDIEGTTRAATGAAGAYHYGTATTSNFLFFF